MANYRTPMHIPKRIWDALWNDARVLFEMMSRWNYTNMDCGGVNAEPDSMAVACNDLNHALTKALIELFGQVMADRIAGRMYDHGSLADAVAYVFHESADEVTAMIEETSEAFELWRKVSDKLSPETAKPLFEEYDQLKSNLWDHVFGTGIPDVDSEDTVWEPYRISIDRIVHGWNR